MQTATEEKNETIVSSTNTPNARVVETTSRVTPEHVVGEHPLETYKQKKVIFRTYQVIWYILGVIEVLLIFRILLKMLGANPNSGFANLIYVLTEAFAYPFAGILQVSYAQGHVFEWTTMIAMVVYVILAYGLVQLFQLVKPTTPQEVHETVDNV